MNHSFSTLLYIKLSIKSVFSTWPWCWPPNIKHQTSTVNIGLKDMCLKSEVQNQWFLVVSTSLFWSSIHSYYAGCGQKSIVTIVGRTAAAKLVEFQPKDLDAFGNAFFPWSRHLEHQGGWVWRENTPMCRAWQKWSSRKFSVLYWDKRRETP